VRALALALFLLFASCKKSEPPKPDETAQVRPRPQEVAHVTLKVVGMT
jgi:hypothetical protein